ncbi:tail fiber assembly protein [Kluyvera georgiana]|uniref:tail fiber assembly protein n=1 Tax=Kluyvera georgiana TaxID=73098 RepID=UPI003D97CC74
MKYFKNESGTVYAYEDAVDEKYVKSGLTEISEADALALASPAPTQAELVLLAEQKKTALRMAADAEIEWRQYAVNKGIATDEESAALDEWSLYRVLLMRVDTTKPEWPTPPAAEN